MAYQWTKTDAAAPERVLLIGLDCGDYDAEASMAELERLTDTAGGLVVGHTVQKRLAPEGATYIGSGLVESLAEFCRQNEVDLTVADGSLTPVQARNLERALGTAVIDRTALILDIFADRAKTSGAGPAAIPAAPVGRAGQFFVSIGRRYRYPRPRRKQVGKRPAPYSPPDYCLAAGVKDRAGAAGADASAPPKEPGADGSAGGLYQCG